MSPYGPLALAALLLVGAFAGCLDASDASEAQELEPKKLAGKAFENAVFPGAYRFDGSYSYTLAQGPFAFSKDTPLELGKMVYVPSDFVMSGQDVGLNAPGTGIQMGIWLPDVPEGTKVPVIVDAGPYYAGENINLPAGRLGKFLIENFVPHGYAVAQLAVRGTADHAGCFDFFGEAEQQDLSTAITWLGTQPWSNGAVGMIGRSYDGSTPWEVAAQGNEHLKTIVPISGLSDVFGLMNRNGTNEGRHLTMHSVVYWPSGLRSAGRAPENIAINLVCPEMWRSLAHGLWSTQVGDRGEELSDYNDVRNFQRFAREKWKGSVFMIHGLQDWNVDPYMGAPIADLMESEGHQVKQLWGQWGHMYPDRPGEHVGSDPADPNTACGAANTRWDWAEILLHWFDRELKGLKVDTGPPVQILDSACRWRNEEHYPPHDATWTPLSLTAENKLSAWPEERSGSVLLSAQPVPGSVPRVEFTTGPLADGLRFSGLPKLHVTVTPEHASGFLYAGLFAENETGARTQLGTTAMNLRYHQGGEARQTLIPGQPVVARMEIYPLDLFVPAGHSLVLALGQGPGLARDHTSAGSQVPSPVSLEIGGAKSVLTLPVIERDESVFFAPPQPPAGQAMNNNSGPGSE